MELEFQKEDNRAFGVRSSYWCSNCKVAVPTDGSLCSECNRLHPRPAYKTHAEQKIRPARVTILGEAISLTAGERDVEYGSPEINLQCAAEFKALFRKWMPEGMNPAEAEAHEMHLTKLARRLCGQVKRDTFVDGAGYWAIAGEIALSPP